LVFRGYDIFHNEYFFQHYPMYRESDEICNELDQAPNEIKAIKFRERWECLSKEASEQVRLLIAFVAFVSYIYLILTQRSFRSF